MSKTIKSSTTGQLNLLDLIKEVSRKQAEVTDHPETSGKASIDAATRHIISNSLKHTKLSRYEVAARMSEILGCEITKAQIDAWSAESKENHRFPYVYTQAFCLATGDKALTRHMCELCGGFFIEGVEALELELGKIHEARKDLGKKEKLIMDTLRQVNHGR